MPNQTIYLVIIEDRHVDVEVLPFSTEDLARTAAGKLLAEYGGEVVDEDAGLNPAMVADGWIAYVRYSVEGDSIRIIKRQLDGPHR